MAEEIRYQEELEPFMSQFENANIRATSKGLELISSSPFREDVSPSFSLNLETGLWIDFGSSDEVWRSGNFFQLMTFLTGEDYEEVKARYNRYDVERLADVDAFKLNVELETPTEYKTYDLEDFNFWSLKSNYLNLRGITDKVQRAFKIGYNGDDDAIAFPYFDKDGHVVNVKFRKVDRKQFYYLKDGQPIGQHVYGLHMVKRMDVKRVFVVESEIDCLYLWSYGYPAVAMGSANMSKRQEELLDLSGITELVLAFDNDGAGKAITSKVRKRLSGRYDISRLIFPKHTKDVNDIPKEILEDGKLQSQHTSISVKLTE